MAVDDELICNFRKCRKKLKNFAWTTSCSHVFCDEDGGKLFSNRTVCPACDTDLPGKYDIVRVDLQPSEEYKSMLLAGQRPETIIEICSRALSFWTYQSHQERIYQEYIAGKLKDKLTQVEGYYEQLLSLNQAELSSSKALVESQRKELESLKLKHNESSEKLMDKSRQHQKLQAMYDTLRRRSVTMATFDDPNEAFIPSPQRHISRVRQQIEAGQIVAGRIEDGKSRGNDHAQKLTAGIKTAHSMATLQVDPGLATAVNVGAMQQYLPAHLQSQIRRQ